MRKEERAQMLQKTAKDLQTQADTRRGLVGSNDRHAAKSERRAQRLQLAAQAAQMEAQFLQRRAQAHHNGRIWPAGFAEQKIRALVFRYPWLKRTLLNMLSPDTWQHLTRKIRLTPEKPISTNDFAAVIAAAGGGLEPEEKRVVLVCGSLQPGGAERQVANTLIGLDSRGLDSLWLLCDRLAPGHPERYDHYLPLLRDTQVHIRSLLESQPPPAELPQTAQAALERLPANLANDVMVLYRHFLEIRPEVVHAWLDWSNVRAGIAAAMAGVPKIFLSGRNLNPSHFALYQPYMDPAYEALVTCPNVTMLNNSRAGANDYAAWLKIPAADIQVVYNGVALGGTQRTSAAALTALRDELGIPEGDLVVGTSFRFNAEKRPLLWLDCAAAIAAQRPDTSFVIYGDGQLQKSMLDHARKLGIADRLHMPGITSDMVTALSLMDVLLLTSFGEGTPNVALEAQWLGTPVVATDAGGVAESVQPGETGIVCRSPDAEALAGTVVELLNDPEFREQAKQAGPAFIEKRFGLRRMIDETMALYGFQG
jgi:glycosyltransferase involved in cell wall biosynthesis